MGEGTRILGSLKIIPDLTQEDKDWLLAFNLERHGGTDYPGIWCQWIPEKCFRGWEEEWYSDNTLAWDKREKFYNYVEWLKWLIDNFFIPKGYILNGSVIWQGPEIGDVGTITVKTSTVRTHAWADLISIR